MKPVLSEDSLRVIEGREEPEETPPTDIYHKDVPPEVYAKLAKRMKDRAKELKKRRRSRG